MSLRAMKVIEDRVKKGEDGKRYGNEGWSEA